LRLLLAELIWIPLDSDQNRAAVISLTAIDFVDNEDDTTAILLIDLKDGDQLRLDFGTTGRAMSALYSFERQLHAACDAAKTVAAPDTEAAKHRTKQATPQETRCVKEGRELRAGLQQVSKLKSADRTKQAPLKLDSLHSGKNPSEGTINVRAFELAGILFKVGNLELTRAVLDKFLSLRDVKQLLPEVVRKTRQGKRP